MQQRIKLGDVEVDVIFKDIKNIHLSVYPPTGRVRISAPKRMSLDTIRVYAVSRIGWIRSKAKRIVEQERESPREYLERESHYVWGRRYLLQIVETDRAPFVELAHNRLSMFVRENAPDTLKESSLAAWYREQIKSATPPLLAKWQPLIGVQLQRFFVQRMKTKWGSCNPNARTIRLNTELAKKPRECLEYIVVHELLHLLEPTHNARFTGLLQQYLPNWRVLRDRLNRLPVRHEDWVY